METLTIEQMRLAECGDFWNDLGRTVWTAANGSCLVYGAGVALAHFGLVTPPTAVAVAVMDIGCGAVALADAAYGAWYFHE